MKLSKQVKSKIWVAILTISVLYNIRVIIIRDEKWYIILSSISLAFILVGLVGEIFKNEDAENEI